MLDKIELFIIRALYYIAAILLFPLYVAWVFTWP